MTVKVACAQINALDGHPVSVEMGWSKGFSGIQLVGATGDVCRQGLERAKTALEQLPMTLPSRRIVVSLTPAELKKDGGHFDLAFAIGLYCMTQNQPLPEHANNWMFVGELGLDGRLLPVRSAVSMALTAMSAGFAGIALAKENLPDLKLLEHTDAAKSFEILGFSHLHELLSWLKVGDIPNQQLPEPEVTQIGPGLNFDDMVLSPELEKLICSAMTGMHNIYLQGSPGTGKSMLASRLPALLPKVDNQLHLEILRINSARLATLPHGLIAGTPPFRSPHHGASAAAILGTPDIPGEISLAHGGLLFLDEFPEFRRDVIEGLREPLESHRVQVARAKAKTSWHSKTTLIAACNPCPCGWFGSRKHTCACPTTKIQAYKRKISGPILDRIDIHLNMPEHRQDPGVLFAHLNSREVGATIPLAKKVADARDFAKERNRKFGTELNRDLPLKQLNLSTELSEAKFSDWLNQYAPKAASLRSIGRSLRVARSLADLDQVPIVREQDMAQAFQWHHRNAAKQRGDDSLGL